MTRIYLEFSFNCELEITPTTCDGHLCSSPL